MAYTQDGIKDLSVRPVTFVFNGEFEGRVKMGYYEAGHMMYIHKPSFVKLKQDLTEFIRITSGRCPRAPWRARPRAGELVSHLVVGVGHPPDGLEGFGGAQPADADHLGPDEPGVILHRPGDEQPVTERVEGDGVAPKEEVPVGGGGSLGMGASLGFAPVDGKGETAMAVAEHGHESGHLYDDIVVGEGGDARFEAGGGFLEGFLGYPGKGKAVGGLDLVDEEVKVGTPHIDAEDPGGLLGLDLRLNLCLTMRLDKDTDGSVTPNSGQENDHGREHGDAAIPG